MATNHWSVSIGSITWPVRLAARHHQLVLLDLNQQTLRIQVGHDLLAGHEAVQTPVGLGALSLMRA